jgi:hypothetical protein
MVISRLQIEGVLAYFTHLKCQKCIEDDVMGVGDVRYVFFMSDLILGIATRVAKTKNTKKCYLLLNGQFS